MISDRNIITPTLVSVCVPTFNHVNFIKTCLDSILVQQTDFDFEIILGEDDSKDGTRAICIEYAERFPEKIRLFLRNRADVIYINGNPTGRYNFTECLKQAKSKYIALCEGDDCWTDSLKLQKQVNFLEKNNDYAGCFHYTQQLLEDNSLGKLYGKHADKYDFNTVDTFSTLALFHTSSFMFRNKDLELPLWYYQVVSADMALFSFISKAGTIRCIPEVMSIYRSHPGGLTKTTELIRNYHKDRIDLLNNLNQFHNYNFNEEAQKVIKYHEKMLHAIEDEPVKNNSFFVRLKKILKLKNERR